jgi:DNA-binding transcriptional LysR family regulator
LVERRPGDVVLTDIGVEVAERGQQILARSAISPTSRATAAAC